MKSIPCFLLLVGLAQAQLLLREKAQDCLQGTDLELGLIEDLAKNDALLIEETASMEKFFGCLYDPFISDDNELIANDRLLEYTVDYVARRLEGRKKLAKLLAREILKDCGQLKGDTKGKTAIAVINCVKKELQEYNKKE